MSFVSFSCLNALAKTSRTMLNSSGESRRLCLGLDLRGKFLPLSIMFATGFFANALCHIDALTFKSKKLLSQK